MENEKGPLGRVAPSEGVAITMMSEDMVNEELHHSLPSPDPSKPFKNKKDFLATPSGCYTSKKLCCIWVSTALLVIVVIGGFVGTFLRKVENEIQTVEGHLQGLEDSSVRYRHREVRKMVRSHEHRTKKEFDITQVFLP